MGSLVIGTIIDAARRTLFELKVGQTSAADVRWDRTRELLPLANRAQRVICAHIPSAFTKNTSLQLATGAKQTIPSDGRFLFNVEHNLGVGGSTVGRVITIIDRTALSHVDPDWMTATGAEVEHYIYDQRDQKTFYVYPRPSGAWYVNLSYPANPVDVSAANIDSGTISVDDIYDTPIQDFIVGYAMLKNFRASDYQKAAFYLERFESQTGIKLQRDTQFAPLDQPAELAVPDALGKA